MKKVRSLRALVELNANIAEMNADGYTPIHLARKHSKTCPELLDILTSVRTEEEQAKPEENPEKKKMKKQKLKRSVIKAATKGDDESLENLLEGNDEIDPEIIESALFVAARSGNEEIMGKLLEHAEIELPSLIDENGQTLLHVAVIGRNANIISELVSEEVPVNHVDHKQKTALHIALMKRNTPIAIIRALCTSDADFSIQNQNGDTPLHLLFSTSVPEKELLARLEAILERIQPEHLNIQNNLGATALICAASQYDLCTNGAIQLIRAGIDVNIVDNDGHSAIYWAVKRNHVHLCKELVYNGAIIENQEALFAGAQKRLVNEILEALEGL